MATGRGSLSMRCTGVQETIERQHRSWRLKTVPQDKKKKKENRCFNSKSCKTHFEVSLQVRVVLILSATTISHNENKTEVKLENEDCDKIYYIFAIK